MTSPLRQIERLEVGEHLRALREACERNILTRFVEARPELVDLGIRVRAFDRVVGLPLENFDDGAVLRTHRLSGPLRDEFLSAEHGHMVAHAIEKLSLLPRMRPVCRERNDAHCRSPRRADSAGAFAYPGAQRARASRAERRECREDSVFLTVLLAIRPSRHAR